MLRLPNFAISLFNLDCLPFQEHKMMIVGSARNNATKAIDTAYEHLSIPKIISPVDLTNPNVDDLRLSFA